MHELGKRGSKAVAQELLFSHRASVPAEDPAAIFRAL